MAHKVHGAHVALYAVCIPRRISKTLQLTEVGVDTLRCQDAFISGSDASQNLRTHGKLDVLLASLIIASAVW